MGLRRIYFSEREIFFLKCFTISPMHKQANIMVSAVLLIFEKEKGIGLCGTKVSPKTKRAFFLFR